MKQQIIFWMSRISVGVVATILCAIVSIVLSGLCTGDESFVPFQWYKEECKKTGRRFETNFRQINEEETR